MEIPTDGCVSSVNRVFDPVRLRYLDSRGRVGVRAAGDALRDLLPAAWRRQLGAGPRRLWFRPQGHELVLERQLDDQRDIVGAIGEDEYELRAMLQSRLVAAGAVQRWLLLDTGQVLRRTLSLPLAAEPRLRDLLGTRSTGRRRSPPTRICEARVLDRDLAPAVRASWSCCEGAARSGARAIGARRGWPALDVREVDGTPLA